MQVKKSIQNSFRKLFAQVPYKDITITQICRDANVSRGAFYDYFPNKEAIANSIVEDEVVEPQKILMRSVPIGQYKSSPQILTEMLYQPIYQNGDFYTRLNKIDKGSLLVRMLTEGFMSLNEEILKSYKLPQDEERYASFFFAVSNAELVSKWLDNGMDITPARLCRLFNKWTLHYWLEIRPNKMDWM